MKQLLRQLTDDLRDEYLRQDAHIFRAKVELYILVTTAIFFAVSLQFLFRKTVLLMDTFRSWELTLWAILILGAFLCFHLNRKARQRRQSKRCALLFTGIFLWSFSGLSVIYPETELVSGFYYAFALLATCTMIPWRISEILWISALYGLAFLTTYDYVTFVMRYTVPVLPRFFTPVDGLVVILISACAAVILRKKELERDIYNFILLKKVESQNMQMDRDLVLARRVHKTLVPDSFRHDRADMWVSYIPMSYVSGDYAKIRFLGPNHLLVFISDVTGHGVAAALLVNRVHAEFERLIQERPEPLELLFRLNEFIAKDFEGTSMYLSAFCGLFDFEKHEFRYSNFGHPAQLLFGGRTSEIRPLSSQNMLLGVTREAIALEQGALPFQPGDRLLLFTDGVIETTDEKGNCYGEERLQNFLIENEHLRDGRFNEKLVNDLSAFRGGAFTDDIYILNILTKPVMNSETAAYQEQVVYERR